MLCSKSNTSMTPKQFNKFTWWFFRSNNRSKNRVKGKREKNTYKFITLSKWCFEQNCWLLLSCLCWLCPSWTNLWRAVDRKLNQRNTGSISQKFSKWKKMKQSCYVSLIMIYLSGKQEGFLKFYSRYMWEVSRSF